MKKKCLMNVLAVAVTCAMLAGCSQQTANTAPTKADEETIDTADTEEVAEEPEEEKEKEEEVQEVAYLLSVTSANEDGTYSGCDKEKTEYTLTLSEAFPEEQKELLKPEAVVTVTGPENSLANTESGKSFTITAVQAQEEETEDTVAVKKVAFEKVNGFTVDDTVTGTMYAKQSVNVRKGPSTDYDKLGALSFAQEINVTGVADSGWYQFDFNGEKGYVSNKYVVTEKPEAKTVASTSASSSGTSVASNSGGSGSSSSANAPYMAADFDAAWAAGDVDKVSEMLRADAAWELEQAGLSSDSSSSSSSSSGGSSTSSEKSTSTSREFVDYMNQKRAEAGLSALSWSDSLAATACERAEEIVTDFSHNGSRNCSLEICQMNRSCSVSGWYSQFYNSEGHRLCMMTEANTQTAAAVCKVGNTYYIVALFD